MKRMLAPLPFAVAAVVLPLAPVAAIVAQDDVAALPGAAGVPSANPTVDEAALAELKRAADAVGRLTRYRVECWTTVTSAARVGGGKGLRREHEYETLVGVKPNLMRYDQWAMSAPEGAAPGKGWKKKQADPTCTYVVDGKNAWRQFGETFSKDARTAPAQFVPILEPCGGFYTSEHSAFSKAQRYRKRGELKEARLDGTAKVDGTLCRKVFTRILTSYDGRSLEYRTTWYVGADDGLVRRQAQWFCFDGEGGILRDSTLRGIQTDAEVKTTPALFTYQPPKGVRPYAEMPEGPLLASGTTAPDFTATTADGQPVKLSDYKGRVVVLDFWATWCGPCVASMPNTQKLAQKLEREGLPVTVLALDNSDRRDVFLSWVKRHPELNAVVFAHADLEAGADIAGKLYKVSSIPTQYVIDADGVIRASFVGESDSLEKAIRATLKQ